MSKPFKFSKTSNELLFSEINPRLGGRKLRLLVNLDTGKVKKGNIITTEQRKKSGLVAT